ncbi:hypothetical protein FHG87_003874 [Trinorchestia longiramus]|nr:hypothetical protein FHG87_003874 [Trinorchestia longiramus]
MEPAKEALASELKFVLDKYILKKRSRSISNSNDSSTENYPWYFYEPDVPDSNKPQDDIENKIDKREINIQTIEKLQNSSVFDHGNIENLMSEGESRYEAENVQWPKLHEQHEILQKKSLTLTPKDSTKFIREDLEARLCVQQSKKKPPIPPPKPKKAKIFLSQPDLSHSHLIHFFEKNQCVQRPMRESDLKERSNDQCLENYKDATNYSENMTFDDPIWKSSTSLSRNQPPLQLLQLPPPPLSPPPPSHSPPPPSLSPPPPPLSPSPPSHSPPPLPLSLPPSLSLSSTSPSLPPPSHSPSLPPLPSSPSFLLQPTFPVSIPSAPPIPLSKKTFVHSTLSPTPLTYPCHSSPTLISSTKVLCPPTIAPLSPVLPPPHSAPTSSLYTSSSAFQHLALPSFSPPECCSSEALTPVAPQSHNSTPAIPLPLSNSSDPISFHPLPLTVTKCSEHTLLNPSPLPSSYPQPPPVPPTRSKKLFAPYISNHSVTKNSESSTIKVKPIPPPKPSLSKLKTFKPHCSDTDTCLPVCAISSNYLHHNPPQTLLVSSPTTSVSSPPLSPFSGNESQSISTSSIQSDQTRSSDPCSHDFDFLFTDISAIPASASGPPLHSFLLDSNIPTPPVSSLISTTQPSIIDMETGVSDYQQTSTPYSDKCRNHVHNFHLPISRSSMVDSETASNDLPKILSLDEDAHHSETVSTISKKNTTLEMQQGNCEPDDFREDAADSLEHTIQTTTIADLVSDSGSEKNSLTIFPPPHTVSFDYSKQNVLSFCSDFASIYGNERQTSACKDEQKLSKSDSEGILGMSISGQQASTKNVAQISYNSLQTSQNHPQLLSLSTSNVCELDAMISMNLKELSPTSISKDRNWSSHLLRVKNETNEQDEVDPANKLKSPDLSDQRTELHVTEEKICSIEEVDRPNVKTNFNTDCGVHSSKKTDDTTGKENLSPNRTVVRPDVIPSTDLEAKPCSEILETTISSSDFPPKAKNSSSQDIDIDDTHNCLSELYDSFTEIPEIKFDFVPVLRYSVSNRRNTSRHLLRSRLSSSTRKISRSLSTTSLPAQQENKNVSECATPLPKSLSARTLPYIALNFPSAPNSSTTDSCTKFPCEVVSSSPRILARSASFHDFQPKSYLSKHPSIENIINQSMNKSQETVVNYGSDCFLPRQRKIHESSDSVSGQSLFVDDLSAYHPLPAQKTSGFHSSYISVYDSLPSIPPQSLSPHNQNPLYGTTVDRQSELFLLDAYNRNSLPSIEKRVSERNLDYSDVNFLKPQFLQRSNTLPLLTPTSVQSTLKSLKDIVCTSRDSNRTSVTPLKSNDSNYYVSASPILESNVSKLDSIIRAISSIEEASRPFVLPASRTRIPEFNLTVTSAPSMSTSYSAQDVRPSQVKRKISFKQPTASQVDEPSIRRSSSIPDLSTQPLKSSLKKPIASPTLPRPSETHVSFLTKAPVIPIHSYGKTSTPGRTEKVQNQLEVSRSSDTSAHFFDNVPTPKFTYHPTVAVTSLLNTTARHSCCELDGCTTLSSRSSSPSNQSAVKTNASKTASYRSSILSNEGNTSKLDSLGVVQRVKHLFEPKSTQGNESSKVKLTRSQSVNVITAVAMGAETLDVEARSAHAHRPNALSINNCYKNRCQATSVNRPLTRSSSHASVIDQKVSVC